MVALSRQFPVVSVTGPRQSGKTTLARMVFHHHDYVSLEDPDEREFALTDPRGFLRRFSEGVILDEIQRATGFSPISRAWWIKILCPTGHEVDVVIDTGRSLVPVEIKSGETIDPSFFDGLRYFISLGSPALKTGVLVHGGEALYRREQFVIRPWYRCV